MWKRVKYYATGEWARRHLIQWITNIMVLVHFGLGVAILSGGIERFSLPSYQPLVGLTRGQVWWWGIIIITSAVFIIAPFKYVSMLGLLIGVAWMNMWAALFLVALLHYPEAAATPMVAYAGFALINTALLAARVVERNEE